MSELLIHVLVVLVDLLQELQLLALLHQELFVLFEELLVCGEACCILADAFVEGSLDGADIVSEGHFDELAPVDADYLDATHLLIHVVFLSEDVALA